MIVKNGTVLESKKLYEDKLPAWVSDYLQERGYRSDPRTCALISEYLGNNLQKIAGELDKLLLNFPAGTRSEEHPSELQSLMRLSYAVLFLKKKTNTCQLLTPR